MKPVEPIMLRLAQMAAGTWQLRLEIFGTPDFFILFDGPRQDCIEARRRIMDGMKTVPLIVAAGVFAGAMKQWHGAEDLLPLVPAARQKGCCR